MYVVISVAPHVIQVDLDRNTVHCGGLQPAPVLPTKRRVKLLTALAESQAVNVCREVADMVLSNVSQ